MCRLNNPRLSNETSWDAPSRLAQGSLSFFMHMYAQTPMKTYMCECEGHGRWSMVRGGGFRWHGWICAANS